MTRNSIATCLALSAALGLSTFAADGDQKAVPNSQLQKDRKPQREKKEATSAEKPKASPAKKGDRAQGRWMEIKLTSTQSMLSELTRGNLAGVAKHARATQAIDSLEYWLRGREFRQRSEYHKQLNQYQFALRELARHAEDENIDGALKSWLDINRSCIECHKLLRDQKRPALKSRSTETNSNGPVPAAVKTRPKK